MEKKVPKFMTDKHEIIRFLFFVLMAAVGLILVYHPDVDLRGFGIIENQNFYYIALMILLGFLTLISSRVIFYKINKHIAISFKNFCIWIILEIMAIIIVLSYFGWSLNEPYTRSFLTILPRTAISVVSVLFIPYLISWLYFSLKEKEIELKEALEDVNNESKKGLVKFSDEKGVLRLSVRADDLLFLKSADNYVYVNYLNSKGEIVSYLLRNSLKNIEEQFSNINLIRCHRFYVVNSSQVRLFRKSKDGLLLELDTEEKCEIPVSRTYISLVIDFFSS